MGGGWWGRGVGVRGGGGGGGGGGGVFFFYGVRRRGAAACFIRRESTVARPRRFVPGATVRRGARRRRRFFFLRRSAAWPGPMVPPSRTNRAAASANRTPRHGAAPGAAAPTLFLFCLTGLRRFRCDSTLSLTHTLLSLPTLTSLSQLLASHE